MRLHVTLALFCVLFSKALTLKCYECNPERYEHCTDTETDCPDQCDSKTIVLSIDGQQHETHSKGCAVAGQCITGSLNLGLMKTTSKCCSADLCNSHKVPVLPQGSPNGKKCYTCTDKDCSETVSCEGDQDRCITLTASFHGQYSHQLTIKGCASRSLCTAPTMEETGVTGSLSCCEGDLCNGGEGVKLSLLIMLVPLISSILFL